MMILTLFGNKYCCHRRWLWVLPMYEKLFEFRDDGANTQREGEKKKTLQSSKICSSFARAERNLIDTASILISRMLRRHLASTLIDSADTEKSHNGKCKELKSWINFGWLNEIVRKISCDKNEIRNFSLYMQKFVFCFSARGVKIDSREAK